MPEKQATSSTVYEVWYDAHGGGRRHLKATSKEGVQEHLSYLRDQDEQKQMLATSIGLTVQPHAYNVEVVKVSTQTEPVHP